MVPLRHHPTEVPLLRSAGEKGKFRGRLGTY